MAPIITYYHVHHKPLIRFILSPHSKLQRLLLLLVLPREERFQASSLNYGHEEISSLTWISLLLCTFKLLVTPSLSSLSPFHFSDAEKTFNDAPFTSLHWTNLNGEKVYVKY